MPSESFAARCGHKSLTHCSAPLKSRYSISGTSNMDIPKGLGPPMSLSYPTAYHLKIELSIVCIIHRFEKTTARVCTAVRDNRTDPECSTTKTADELNTEIDYVNDQLANLCRAMQQSRSTPRNNLPLRRTDVVLLYYDQSNNIRTPWCRTGMELSVLHTPCS